MRIESGCHGMRVLSSRSCLIALKHSTVKLTISLLKYTRVTKTVCEGKQLGKKSHFYISSVWQQRNMQ